MSHEPVPDDYSGKHVRISKPGWAKPVLVKIIDYELAPAEWRVSDFSWLAQHELWYWATYADR